MGEYLRLIFIKDDCKKLVIFSQDAQIQLGGQKWKSVSIWFF